MTQKFFLQRWLLFRWRIARQLAGWSSLDEPDSDENSGMYDDEADEESI